MLATNYEVVGRPQHANIRRANIKNFILRKMDPVSARKILEVPQISLYSLDFENYLAVFVETPADIDLSQAPFFHIMQYEKAERVLTIPFEAMEQLAESVTVDDSQLINIYSVGRCGSTLASQIFAQIPGVINLSEPNVLSQLVIARNSKMYNQDDLFSLLKATMRILCKTNAETACVIKGQSFVIELGDWLHALYPQSKNLFLYRNAETWLQSGLRAYGREVEKTEEERRFMDEQRRKILGPLVPAIARYDENKYLSHAGSLSLMWLTAMERYVKLCDMGIVMLAIQYENWRSSPRETARAMLEYCQCIPDDLSVVYRVLERDSQADTHLSRDALKRKERVITEFELEELHYHLQNHAFIQSPDFEVPNTLTL